MSVDWQTTRRRHGTNSGWALHTQLGERPCDPCFVAKQAYDARRLSSPDKAIKNRMRAKAQQLALSELARRHHDEYRSLYRRLADEVNNPQK